MTVSSDVIRTAPVAALHFPSIEPVRVGMPELCRAGLSETWLWKACGHRHWLGLAAAYGLDRPDFRDGQGERLYPAFTDIRLEQARLNAAAENMMLGFEVTLERLSRTRFRSQIDVRSGTAMIARVIMDSAFVRRAVPGRNQSASRGLVAGPCRLLPPAQSRPPFRPTNWIANHGFERARRIETLAGTVDPSPHEDFNGADFLYFAAFQAIVDRVEWAWFHKADPILTTARRHIVYVGNIELGDRVRATLCGKREDNEAFSTWIDLSRASDGAPIALAFTTRRSCTKRDKDAA